MVVKQYLTITMTTITTTDRFDLLKLPRARRLMI